MRWFAFIFVVLFAKNLVYSQSSFFTPGDTLNTPRFAWSTSIFAGVWVGSVVGLKEVWYKDNWTNHFHTFDDSKQWLGMDKAGHFYTGNLLAKNVSSIYRWSGVSRNTSLLIGSSISFGYLASVEVLDGFSDKWGFSWSDLGANTAGVAWFAWQELLWKEQRFNLKFSVHTTEYAAYRPNVLGSNLPERILKDYNGQTYWLSFTPGQFLSNSSRFPKWLSFSFGYSVDEKINGTKNTVSYSHPNHPSEIATNFQAQRQFLFSLDVNLEEIEVKKPWLKTLFKALNHVKIPFPALVLTGSKLGVHPFYF